MKSESVFLWELLYLVYKEFSVTTLSFLSHHLREQNALWFATLCSLYSVEVCLVQVAIWAVITLPESAGLRHKTGKLLFSSRRTNWDKEALNYRMLNVV